MDQGGPFLTLPVALLKRTLVRGSISPRVPLILTPRDQGFVGLGLCP